MITLVKPVKIITLKQTKLLNQKARWHFQDSWNANHRALKKRVSLSSKVFQLELQKNNQNKHISKKILNQNTKMQIQSHNITSKEKIKLKFSIQALSIQINPKLIWALWWSNQNHFKLKWLFKIHSTTTKSQSE